MSEMKCQVSQRFIKYKENIFAYFKDAFLFYVNNQLENLIKQKRLKTIEDIGKDKKAMGDYLNLMTLYYCFNLY